MRSSRAEADLKYITRATLQGASELEVGNSGLPGKHKHANGKKNSGMKTSHSRSQEPLVQQGCLVSHLG